jgi:hypothetical protein
MTYPNRGEDAAHCEFRFDNLFIEDFPRGGEDEEKLQVPRPGDGWSSPSGA